VGANETLGRSAADLNHFSFGRREEPFKFNKKILNCIQSCGSPAEKAEAGRRGRTSGGCLAVRG
jgi:hypothetical protein